MPQAHPTVHRLHVWKMARLFQVYKEWGYFRYRVSNTIWILSTHSHTDLSVRVLTLQVHPYSISPEALLCRNFHNSLYFWFHNEIVSLFVGIEFWFMRSHDFVPQSSTFERNVLFNAWTKIKKTKHKIWLRSIYSNLTTFCTIFNPIYLLLS